MCRRRPRSGRAAKSRRMSTFFLAAAPRRSSNSARLSGLSASSAGSTITSASSRSPSSRSSLAVNFACAGPRRPTTWISRTRLAGQGVQRVLGDVGMPELVHRLGQDPAYVRRHVALAHDDRDLLTQVEGPIAVVGVAVVPAHELRGGVAPGQVLARHPQPAIALRAGGEDHRMVGLGERVHRDVASHGDVAVEPEPRRARDPVVDRDRLLELRVVGRHAEPHQAERRRQALQHVHPDVAPRLEQRFGRVEPARPRAHDGDPQRGPAASGTLTQSSKGQRQRRPGRAADRRRAGPKGRSPRRTGEGDAAALPQYSAGDRAWTAHPPRVPFGARDVPIRPDC